MPVEWTRISQGSLPCIACGLGPSLQNKPGTECAACALFGYGKKANLGNFGSAVVGGQEWGIAIPPQAPRIPARRWSKDTDLRPLDNWPVEAVDRPWNLVQRAISVYLE